MPPGALRSHHQFFPLVKPVNPLVTHFSNPLVTAVPVFAGTRSDSRLRLSTDWFFPPSMTSLTPLKEFPDTIKNITEMPVLLLSDVLIALPAVSANNYHIRYCLALILFAFPVIDNPVPVGSLWG
jgi:hypothetical protein